MTEPRDEIGAWLDAPVEPLPPSPGTYERVKRRARRRKRNQAIAAAATATAVVAGFVAAPRLANALFPTGHGGQSAAAGPQGTSSSRTPAQHNRLSAAPTAMGTGEPLPSGFEPISATFVGLDTGWALGTLSTPCPADGCLALARTDNAGATWYRVTAPSARPATANTGVSQVRFLNRDDGWVFGPDLWWTRDSGQNWQRVDTAGTRVISLETVGDRAFAVFARCPAGEPLIPNGGAGGCASYQLYSARAGTPAWQPVPGAVSGAGTGSVVLGQDTGYLLGGAGDQVSLSSGPVSGNGAWTAAAAPCKPGGKATSAAAGQGTASHAVAGHVAGAQGSPSAAPATPGPASASAGTSGTGGAGTGGADTAAAATTAPLLATAASDGLFAVCTAGAAPAKEIVTSADGGRSWQARASAAIPGAAHSFAAAPGGRTLVIATSAGLYVSGDGGVRWRLAVTGPPAGFGYVGMTDVLQGFAIPAHAGQGGILFTMDGGKSWRWSAIARPG